MVRSLWWIGALLIGCITLGGCADLYNGGPVVEDTYPEVIAMTQTYEGADLCLEITWAYDRDNGGDVSVPVIIGIVGMEISIPGEDDVVSTGQGTTAPGHDQWIVLTSVWGYKTCFCPGETRTLCVTVYDDEGTANSYTLECVNGQWGSQAH